MSPEEKQWMDQLCRLIQAEQDPDKFSALVRELDDFLEKREIRLKKGLGERSRGTEPR
jgi:hypothetical protein